MNTIKPFEAIARDALGASKKRKQISNYLKKLGFLSLGKGSWLGFRNNDIVSGFVIEGSSLDTYISSFVLPSYDKHTFVTWSLGERLVHCSLESNTHDECEKAIKYYSESMLNIKSPEGIMDYIDKKSIQGGYAIWVKYISYLVDCRLDEAEKYLDDVKINEFHPSQLDKFNEIKRFVEEGSSDEVISLLKKWRDYSERIFGPFQNFFCAL